MRVLCSRSVQSCWIDDYVPLLCFKGQFSLERLELLSHLSRILLMQFLKLIVFELEEHELEHLLLTFVIPRLIVLEGAHGRDHDLLVDCLQDRFAFKVVSFLYEVRHPSIFNRTSTNSRNNPIHPHNSS